ncbi:MarR family winged helix-turn-helix transcriptional regulator [Marinobacterium marinum]|uniref:Winged helix-turn-helix transcriptional regulator n=1 Tax=Marinobacterium marinum TaxID=2756129 RepID=A0A7W2ABG0_9GAMM|nr:MarR family winged helix-turn-helix transcriptional regulator [Marinobacterium marinum]MBA4502901.1 winged helix-turn-helix transcriptional regulator [Marinobacterium marinum]
MPAPAPSQQKFGIRFTLLARLWRRTLDQLLAQEGVTDISWSPLIHLLEGGDGCTQKELAARAGIDGSSLVRLLDTLVVRGFVERKPDLNDRRRRYVLLTPSGHQEAMRIRGILDGIEARMLEAVSDAEIEQTTRVLSRIRKRLQSLSDEAAQ